MAKRKKLPPYLYIDLFQFYVWLCGNEEEFAAIVKHTKQDLGEFTKAGRCSHIVNEFSGFGHSVIQVAVKNCKNRSELVGVLAHESLHVAQRIIDDIGESAHAHELPAYLTQFICQWAYGLLVDRIPESSSEAPNAA